MDVNEMWDGLLETHVATERELQLVSDGWGFNEQTMLTVLQVRTGCWSFEQWADEVSA